MMEMVVQTSALFYKETLVMFVILSFGTSNMFLV